MIPNLHIHEQLMLERMNAMQQEFEQQRLLKKVQERGKTMKKQLIIVFAVSILFLSACGSLVATASTSSTTAPHASSIVTTNSPQVACHILQARQTSISRDIQNVSARLSTASAGGNRTVVRQAEQTLIGLYRLLAQGQAELKACPATH